MLRTLDCQLAAMIAVADEMGDSLLGALLCEAQARVIAVLAASPPSEAPSR